MRVVSITLLVVLFGGSLVLSNTVFEQLDQLRQVYANVDNIVAGIVVNSPKDQPLKSSIGEAYPETIKYSH